MITVAQKLFRRFGFARADSGLDPSPFAISNTVAPAAARAHDERLAALGIRAMPYPFAGAMAIVSDIDAAQRLDYDGYVGQIVTRLGLDFGDSFRLSQASGVHTRKEALAFYRCDGAGPPASEEGRHEKSLGFGELLHGLHVGNVDHLHGLNATGPRVVWLRDVVRRGPGHWAAVQAGEVQRQNTRPFNFRAYRVPIVRVAVIGAAPLPADAEVLVRSVTEEGVERAHVCRPVTGADADAAGIVGPPGATVTWLDVEPEGVEPVPLVGELREVEVRAPGDDAPAVEAVCLTNLTQSMTRAMLDDLVGRFGARINLLTDHASKLFVSESAEERHADENAARADLSPLPALYARVTRGDAAYSTLGDDDASVCHALPVLRTSADVRFINPGGRSGEPLDGFAPLDAVLPTAARDGSHVYLARRLKIEIPEPNDLPADLRDELRDDMGTRSFPRRLARLLELHRERPGRAWPMYTHLGNFAPKPERPSPYLPDAPLTDLQNAVFGIDGTVAPGARLWFTRASVLYDYLLVHRSIGDHLSRDGDVVHVTSWHDDVLDRRLPVAPEQLHGLTVYVDDADDASVHLDGAPIDTLTRNPPDETGRASVTVVGAPIRHVVLDDVDHVTTAAPTFDDGVAYGWVDDADDAYRGRGYAELELVRDGVHRVTWRPRDLHPVGSQYLAWAVYTSDDDARLRLEVETTGGGRFAFGHPIDERTASSVCASYDVTPAPAGDWQRIVAPFHDMQWRDDAHPGGPFPSHAVASISLVVSGAAGDRIAVDQVEFLRPGTSAVDTTRGCVVGGRVTRLAGVWAERLADFARALVLSYTDADGTPITHTDPVVDHQGWFAFTGIPAGAVVEITATLDGVTRHPTRGARFDVWGHDMCLVIEA